MKHETWNALYEIFLPSVYSAALAVTGTMAVDAFVTKTGLRMRNTLHSSTSLKGRIQLSRGQQLNIELDTPEEKLEIFGAK